MQYFETEFINQRSITVNVEEDGRTLLTLAPGEKKFVESRSPSTTYAPWYRITFKADGTVGLDENQAWRWPGPPDQLMLTIINRDGALSEMFRIGAGEPVLCYKGIPRYVGIPYWDAQWRFVERLEIKNVEHVEKQGDYVVRKSKLEQIRTLRPRKEIKRIQEKLLSEASKEAREKLKLMFAQVDGPEG